MAISTYIWYEVDQHTISKGGSTFYFFIVRIVFECCIEFLDTYNPNQICK